MQPSPSEVPQEGWVGADLNLLDGMDDKHVLEVLHGTLHPVVEGGCPLGVFQVQLVNGLQLFLCFLVCGKGQGQRREVVNKQEVVMGRGLQVPMGQWVQQAPG